MYFAKKTTDVICLSETENTIQLYGSLPSAYKQMHDTGSKYMLDLTTYLYISIIQLSCTLYHGYNLIHLI